MKRLLFLLFISSLAFNADAQRKKKDKWPPLPLILFDSKEAYDLDKGEKVGEFRGYDWTVGKLALLTYVDKKNVKRHPAMTLWGCKVTGSLMDGLTGYWTKAMASIMKMALLI